MDDGRFILRTFMPVGHGGFCIERFDFSHVVVYDCGSNAPVRIKLEEMIRREFVEGCTIDKLFISHFHRDHINGIKTLLAHCSVQEVFVPLLTPIDQILLYGSMCFGGVQHDFAESFLLRPLSTVRGISPSTQIIAIAPGPSSGPALAPSRVERDFYSGIALTNLSIEPFSQTYSTDASSASDGLFDSVKIMPSGTVLHIGQGNPFWRLIPYCFLYSERRKRLIDELARLKVQMSDILDAVERPNSEMLGRIREAYASAVRRKPDECNFHTMTLYSGPVTDCLWSQRLIKSSQLESGYSRLGGSGSDALLFPPGCMYFGDFEAKREGKAWQGFCDYFVPIWPYSVGCVQVPHHGSWRNYMPELAKPNAAFVVEADGERHPDTNVLVDLLNHWRLVCVATENPLSRVEFEIMRNREGRG